MQEGQDEAAHCAVELDLLHQLLRGTRVSDAVALHVAAKHNTAEGRQQRPASAAALRSSSLSATQVDRD